MPATGGVETGESGLSIFETTDEKAKLLKEADVLKACRIYLVQHGWKITRHQQGMGARKGFPDLTAIRDGITIYVEIKKPAQVTESGRRVPGGVLSDDQRKFQAETEAAGGIYIVATGIDDLEPYGLYWRETQVKIVSKLYQKIKGA